MLQSGKHGRSIRSFKFKFKMKFILYSFRLQLTLRLPLTFQLQLLKGKKGGMVTNKNDYSPLFSTSSTALTWINPFSAACFAPANESFIKIISIPSLCAC